MSREAWSARWLLNDRRRREAHVYCDDRGKVRVITTEPTYQRLVQRSSEKVRQAGRGMSAIMIRQLAADAASPPARSAR